MKRFPTLLILGALALGGDEIQRIESIVNDVTQLRLEHDACRERLVQLEKAAGEERKCDNEAALQARIAELETALAQARESERMSRRSLKHAEEQVDQLNQLVSEQKRHIATLNGPQTVRVAKEKAEVPTPCREVNPFPELVMKSEPEAAVVPPLPVKAPQTRTVTAKDETVLFKASAFRLREDAEIYDAPGGNVVEQWEAHTSFTSNMKRSGWIRITGYFVDRKWRPAGNRELWVQEAVTLKR